MSAYQDVVIFLHPNRKDYLAHFGEDGWLQWPAREDGWKARKGGKEHEALTVLELDARLADLALRLSKVNLS